MTRALVTGAGTPIGGAVARELRGRGVTVTDAPDEPVDLAVYADVVDDALAVRPLSETDERAWRRRCEEPIRAFVEWLPRVHPLVAPTHGAVVLVAPTVSQEGAAGLVPYTTAVEAQRLLAKSAARQWAADGITVVVVAPRLDAMAPGVDAADALRTDPVLDASTRDADSVARVVALLADPAARAMTGGTLAVDGGALMAP
jgi:3-oxoacyl-[acyl-carrier protein] reductase